MSTRSVVLLTAIAGFAAAIPAGARAETVVVHASGPSAANFARGAILQDADQIRLIRGDSLRVLVAGATRILTGPYSGPANVPSSAEADGAGWNGLLRAKPKLRAAATRGVNPALLASK